MRVALAQINPVVGDIAGNQKKILSYITQAKAKQADVVVFPELVICGYPPEDLLFKEHFIAEQLKAINSIAKGVKDIAVIVGFANRNPQKKLFNAAAVLANGKLQGVYHKRHLPNYSVFDEKRYFCEGNTDILFNIAGTTCSINICEDIWVKNSVFTRQAKQGAKVIFNISCSPYEVTKVSARDDMLKERAKEAKAHVIYCNIVGGQDELVFDGSSIVVDPSGEIIASAAQFDEDLLIVDIEPSAEEKATAKKIVTIKKNIAAKKEKLTKAPVRRLKVIEKVYCALVMGTRDYIEKNGFKKVVIGLSGGVDSALVAAIACDAIGKKNVTGVSMPSKFSSKETQSDAKKVADNLGMKFIEIPIGKTFDSYLLDLKKSFEKEKPNVAEENIQARIRGNLLMALSNKFGWLLLTTGNKSEMAVGYCTLYGDMSGGYAVIKDIVKTKVYKLCQFRNQIEGKDIIPKSILDRPPSAELRDNQKDQDSLPPYDVLDKIVVGYVEKHQSIAEMMKTVKDRKLIERIIGLIDLSEYKRRQAPPGVKITQRAFGKDWRVPITNRYKEFKG